ncbi:MAG: hypothetical protein HC934_06935 [Acaryochloridaceae cyanobacterium SU_2_1]|nr:hypothetical protein [Acaryochloridaceae cyanobacterium SU_2_1]
MDQFENNRLGQVEAELLQVREQLKLRDQLVDQLSTELFRRMKTSPAALPPASSPLIMPLAQAPAESEPLRQELQAIESQIEFYQQQIDNRDTQIAHLQQSCQRLSERNQVLEHIIQELPEVYRHKFSSRLDLVKTKVKSLQLENRRLYSQLQGSQSESGPPQTRPAPQMSLPAQGQQSS